MCLKRHNFFLQNWFWNPNRWIKKKNWNLLCVNFTSTICHRNHLHGYFLGGICVFSRKNKLVFRVLWRQMIWVYDISPILHTIFATSRKVLDPNELYIITSQTKIKKITVCQLFRNSVCCLWSVSCLPSTSAYVEDCNTNVLTKITYFIHDYSNVVWF